MSKGNWAVRDTVNDIIESLKHPAELAEPLAQVFFSRNKPMAKWSYLNRLICVFSGCTDARGPKQWEDVNRKVVNKNKPRTYIRVRATLTKDENGEKLEKPKTIYMFRPVWNITDTTGESLVTDEENEYLDALPFVEMARNMGVTVRTDETADVGMLGMYQVSSDGAQELVVGTDNPVIWFHELMHKVDDHLGNLVEKGNHWKSETVAQLGASVLASLTGYNPDLGFTSRYLTHYATQNGREAYQNAMDVIMRTCEAVEYILANAEK